MINNVLDFARAERYSAPRFHVNKLGGHDSIRDQNSTPRMVYSDPYLPYRAAFSFCWKRVCREGCGSPSSRYCMHSLLCRSDDHACT